jgi:hypothetical protein
MWCTQVELAVGKTLVVRSVERGTVSNRRQRVVRLVELLPVVVHVACGDHLQPHGVSDIAQRLASGAISAHVVALQLNQEVVASKDGSAPFGQTACGCEALPLEDAREQAGSAARHYYQSIGELLEKAEIETGVVPVFARQVGLGN